jgi:CheY-like chemotaxis protein
MTASATWNVLVVEDERDIMDLVQSVFEHHGIRSVGVADAEKALDVLEDMQPTLIVIDLALPGMDGWGLLNSVRANKRLAKIPCVAMTAFHTPELAEQAIAAGFNAYFPKPFDPVSFVQELEEIA